MSLIDNRAFSFYAYDFCKKITKFINCNHLQLFVSVPRMT